MKISLTPAFAILTIIFLFGFPKAGVYLGDVPLTLGYVLLAICGTLQLGRLARSGHCRVRADFLVLAMLFFLLAVVEAAMFSAYGYQSVGGLASTVASTIAVPILALLSIHYLLDTLGMERFLRALKVSLAIVFTFGVISFAVYNTTGTVIGIPFLTTTGSDIHLIANRHNLRGSLIKMFSTYNNGNILGVNLLVWGAIAVTGSRISLFQFRSVCVLTLSRSVWLGLATLELVNSVVRRSIRRMMYAVTFVVALMVIVIGASWFVGRDPTTFLLDRNLGGRVASFQESFHGVSTRKVGWTNESLYAAAFLAFGPIGSVLIASIWAVPIFRGGRSPMEVKCRVVLAVYMFIAAAEAAFNLVPTQASYWMIAGIAMGAGKVTSVKVVGFDSSEPTADTNAANDKLRGARPLVGFPQEKGVPRRRSSCGFYKFVTHER